MTNLRHPLRISVLALLAATLAGADAARAQDTSWTPQSIASLGQNASSRTEFSLDRSMLVIASKVDQDNEDLRRVIAGVNGASVHSFRFTGPGLYDPAALDDVRHQYHEAGWMHLVDSHKKASGGFTDLWIRLDHNAISNIAALFGSENQVNFVSVSGSISPIDLMHLSGHFGIPKIEGGVLIPNNDR
jgi:Domain of unknown function (DUF4252)